MGNDNAKAEVKEQNAEQETKIDHQRFQRYRYVSSDDLLEITVDVPEQKEMKIWENDVSTSVTSFQNRESLLLPIRHQYQPKGWCGNIGSVKIYYQHFPYLFSQEIENRLSMGKHFEEQELWYLLYSLVGCAKDFSKLQRKIGDVRPHNIFINEEGQIKISNAFSWPYQKTNFEKTAYQKTLTYIAPEEMALIQKGNLDQKVNRVVAQSFSIGLTLLQSGLLFPAKEIYSLENRTIDINQLNNRLNEWMGLQFISESHNNAVTTYSPLLKNIISALCHPNADQRTISLEIEELLSPYQNQIMNLKQFDKKAVDFSTSQTIQNQPVQQRPPEQLYYSHTVNAVPQQQVFALPSQTYRVGNTIEPKQLVSYTQPTEVYQQKQVIYQQPPKIIQQVNYVSGPPAVNVGANIGSNGYRQVFTRYAAGNQPIQPIQPSVSIKPQGYDPNFQKYSTTNQQFQVPIVPQTQPFSTPQNNTFNLPNVGTTEFNTNNQFFSSSNFQQSQYVSTTAPQYNGFQPQQFAPAPASSDFLKRIDQQLENSRKLYPS